MHVLWPAVAALGAVGALLMRFGMRVLVSCMNIRSSIIQFESAQCISKNPQHKSKAFLRVVVSCMNVRSGVFSFFFYYFEFKQLPPLDFVFKLVLNLIILT